MLEMQTAVYDGTVRLDHVPEAERDHDDEIEAARLSREESQIVHEADKALSLLHEEGSSVAFPEAVEQMRDDMRQVAERLAAVKVDKITQGLEQDIIAALEETIAALEKSIKDLEKKRTPPGQQPSAGQPGDIAAGRQAGRAEDDPLAANADQHAHAAIRRNDRRRAGRNARVAEGPAGSGRAAATCLPGHRRFTAGAQRLRFCLAVALWHNGTAGSPGVIETAGQAGRICR